MKDGHDDLVAGLDAERAGGDRERVGAVADADRVGDADVGRELLLEGLHLGPEDEAARLGSPRRRARGSSSAGRRKRGFGVKQRYRHENDLRRTDGASRQPYTQRVLHRRFGHRLTCNIRHARRPAPGLRRRDADDHDVPGGHRPGHRGDDAVRRLQRRHPSPDADRDHRRRRDRRRARRQHRLRDRLLRPARGARASRQPAAHRRAQDRA